MNDTNRFADLASRMREGDDAARRQFLREMAPCLSRIIKHAAQKPEGSSRLHRLVRAAAARLAPTATTPTDLPNVAPELSQLVSARLWGGGTDLCGATVA